MLKQDDYPPEAGPFPSFDHSRDWYFLKLFNNGKDLCEPISYEAHRAAVDGMLKRCQILSDMITHVFRRGGAQMADILGAGDSAVRRAGRWDQSAMARHYLSLERESMRCLAGFAPSGGTYFLARDVPVPESLLDQVFPQAQVWYVAH